MKIINLMENTIGANNCLYEHGLSFYIETEHHKLLVDTGASNAFLTNAETLGIDLTQVDTVILSHGHYDHAGGILGFAELNSSAKIWMQKSAIDAYYHVNDKLEKYIGIAPEIQKLPQVKWIEGNYRIDEELFVFSGVTGRRLWPSGNLELKVKQGDKFVQDTFQHEQYLVMEEGDKRILISGCAHNGILNILEAYIDIYGTEPDIVISGFHMQKKDGYSEADLEAVKETARELVKYRTRFYTGHCTGEVPFRLLKDIMGEQLIYVHSGDEICMD